MKTLANKSDISNKKIKFLFSRAVTNFSFLLIPIWYEFLKDVPLIIQYFIFLLYFMFMTGQWYLLGKEVDHRLKIYYRANSSMDRILYRVLLGSTMVTLIFSLVTFLPLNIQVIFFWLFFSVLGIFYSWPTRGKIIEEGFSTQFSEFKYLDSFEKTTLGLSFLLLIFSLPEVSLFQNVDALKLYIDPLESLHPALWSLLEVTYLPFRTNYSVYNFFWSLHLYYFFIGIFVLVFYSMVRFFFSRRLSILGVFAILSSWSISRTLMQSQIDLIQSTYSIVLLWTMLWVSKSSTYRSGFFSGLVLFWGGLISAYNIVFIPFMLMMSSFNLKKTETKWFLTQWYKYNLFGVVCALFAFISHNEVTTVLSVDWQYTSQVFIDSIYRKSFFSLSCIGIILYLFNISSRKKNILEISLENYQHKEFSFLFVLLIFLGTLVNKIYIGYFTSIWILAFISLFPLEWLFISISRLRSKRNLIYGVYILICLLDSHFEGRIRIFAKIFFEQDTLKYINEM